MSKEEINLLLKDLGARLSYGVICLVNFKDTEGRKTENMILSGCFLDEYYLITKNGSIYSNDVKPYLRSVSSMTEEEEKEYKHLVAFSGSSNGAANLVDWLNKKMFAYCTIDGKDMFELGLAIAVTEDNNPYKE